VRLPRNPHRPVPRRALAVVVLLAVSAAGQEPSKIPLLSVDGGITTSPIRSPDAAKPVLRKVGFSQAVAAALARNPTALVAAADIRRVSGLMEEIRSASLPILSVNATYTRLDSDRTFQATGPDGGNGSVVVPGKDSIYVSGLLSIPIIAPQAWANWARAVDQVDVSRASAKDVQRTVAINTGRAYLTIYAQKRQTDVFRQARDNSLEHFRYSETRLRGGIGNRLDWARAGQELESNEAALQTSYANLYRSQEALGILLGEDEPVDVEEIPDIPTPPTLDQAIAEAPSRADVLLFREEQNAADKSLNLSWTEYLPTLTITGQPFYQNPSSLTTPETGWQAQAIFTWYIYDGGARYGRTHQREAQLSQSKIQYEAIQRQANSDVRTTLDTMERSRAAVERSRNGAQLANDAMRLAEVAYRAGASTNLELIDAQRVARDAETQANLAENNERQAILDFLAASGRFPVQLQLGASSR
jgi:outer membrane protein